MSCAGVNPARSNEVQACKHPRHCAVRWLVPHPQSYALAWPLRIQIILKSRNAVPSAAARRQHFRKRFLSGAGEVALCGAVSLYAKLHGIMKHDDPQTFAQEIRIGTNAGRSSILGLPNVSYQCLAAGGNPMPSLRTVDFFVENVQHSNTLPRLDALGFPRKVAGYESAG
jgi:hypothetical protein